MNVKDLKDSIIDALTVNLVPMVAGSPGIGKSDLTRAIAKEFKLSVIDLRLSQCDQTDLLGFPTHDGTRMDYAPPIHFPLKGIDKPPAGSDGWLLFLDEFSSASQAVQAAAYKLVLDRQVGKHELHQNVAIICAGNKETDSAIVTRMGTAMQSRLIHLEMEVDHKAWVEWASENGIDHRSVSYIEGRPEHLHNFNPNHDDKTFACPRTWEFASKLIKDKPVSPRLLEMLKGTLSAGVAMEFYAYLTYCEKLPSIAEIKARPDDIPIPDDPSLLYGVSHMVAAYIDETDADRLVRFLKRLPLEFGTTAVRSALKRNRSLMQIDAIRTWAHQIAKEIF